MQTRFLAVILGCSLLFAAQACGSDPKPVASVSITPEQMATLIVSGDAPFVLDVRTEAEFSAGHIPGAVNVPHDELADRMDELPSDRATEIVVHCQSGRRAQTAESILTKAGFTNVLDLTGHMAAWRAGNYPLE